MLCIIIVWVYYWHYTVYTLYNCTLVHKYSQFSLCVCVVIVVVIISGVEHPLTTNYLL